MFTNFLIGLREGLEATLIVGILVAYVIKIGRRDLLGRIWLGVGVAVTISLGLGAVLTFGPSGLTFEAQEIIGGVLSIVAVAFVTWMIVWMVKMSAHLKSDLEHKLGGAVETGGWAITLMAALAVGREGLETALFVWSATKAADAGATPLIGAVLGIAVAVVLGVAITKGAVRLNLGTFFTWTAAALIIVAAGVLAYGVHDLQEAGVLGGLNGLAFDVSAQIPPDSWYGTLLKGTLNFSPATTKLEAAVWLIYVVATFTAFVLLRRKYTARPAAPADYSSSPSPEGLLADDAPAVVAPNPLLEKRS